MKLKDEHIVDLKSTAKKAESVLAELKSQLSLQKTTYEQEISRLVSDSKILTNKVNSFENEKLKLTSTN